MMTHEPRFIIERHEHGWLITAPAGRDSVPVSALTETTGCFPKDAVIVPGIAHHYTQVDRYGFGPSLMAICLPKEAKHWESDIRDWLKDRGPEEQWWKGTDVGLSSAAMFSVLASTTFKQAAWYMTRGQGHTPRDADDMGRCKRLLAMFPEWKARLNEVREAYPNSLWPLVIANWDKLENGTDTEVNELLQSIHNSRGVTA